jgi:hypothetical protein
VAADHPDPSAPSRGTGAGIVVVIVAVVVGVILLTTLAGNPPADVKVKSVNATSTQGLATKVRDILQSRGYTQVALGDAPTPQLTTDIFYTAGAQADAQAVARALGLNASVVKPMPEPPPVSPGDATVLVMAGVDLT